jgi:hypothetical protein
VAWEIFAEKNTCRQLRYTAVGRKSTKRSGKRRRVSTIRHMPKYISSRKEQKAVQNSAD